jgi:hypothetical protein
MHELQIDASPSQMRRLHKGHKVRVKKGTGFSLIVYPETYNIANHAFQKGKGSQLQLTPEEIQMNQGVSPEQHNPPSQPQPEAVGKGLRDMFSHVKLADSMNNALGTNYGYLKRAGLDNAIQGAKSAAMNKMGIDARMMQAPRISGMGGYGLNEPRSRLVGGQIERSSVGRNGGMISAYTPPALVSQPFSANFQFQHFLPPQYQHFSSGGASDFGGSGFH